MTDKFKKKTGDGECDRDDQDKYGFDSDIYTRDWYRAHNLYDTPAHQECKVFGSCSDYNEELRKEAEEQARKEAFERQKAAEKAAAAGRPAGPGWWAAF